MKVLKNLLYTKEHEWVKVLEGKAYIGITDFAQHSLGDIVFVDLPEVDSELSEGDTFGVVESVKAASDVYMPLDGKVLEINETVVDDPAQINENAYENWMILVEISNKAQIDNLMTAEEYEDFCSKEA